MRIDDWDDVAMTDWPAWATEKVEVRPADQAWQEHGQPERLLLDATLGAWLVAPIEHVGSTAVPNLSAKPILDFQAAVTTSIVRRTSLLLWLPQVGTRSHPSSTPGLGDDSSSRSLRGTASHTFS